MRASSDSLSASQSWQFHCGCLILTSCVPGAGTRSFPSPSGSGTASKDSPPKSVRRVITRSLTCRPETTMPGCFGTSNKIGTPRFKKSRWPVIQNPRDEPVGLRPPVHAVGTTGIIHPDGAAIAQQLTVPVCVEVTNRRGGIVGRCCRRPVNECNDGRFCGRGLSRIENDLFLYEQGSRPRS